MRGTMSETRAGRILRILDEKAWIPSPWLNTLKWACADAMTMNPDLLSELEQQEVLVSDLKPTQLALDHDTVEKYAKEGNHDGSLCFRRGGVCYVYDGHHRSASAKKAGRERIKAYVIDLGDKELSLKRFAKKIKQQPEDIVSSMSTDNKRHFEDLI
jgi:hypothetical protein